MTGKQKTIDESWLLDNKEELIDRENIRKQINLEPVVAWVQATDSHHNEVEQANAAESWVHDNNQDALEEYMDDVSDVLLSEDLDSFDW